MRVDIDPKITEEFLLTQEDVQDASVWLSGEVLEAHVTPAPGRQLSELALKGVCVAQIGTHQTPERIILISAQGRS